MADTKIYAEISGSVWKILVKVGDSVEADTALVLLESMKMEIPVVSSDPGVVTEIHVVAGAPISEGDLIITILT